MGEKIIVFGAGEIAELASFYFRHDSHHDVAAFVVDNSHLKETRFQDRPVVAYSELEKDFPPSSYRAHVAISYAQLNKNRQEKYQTMKNDGYSFVSYVSSKAAYWPDLDIGENCLILENQTIQPKVKIGNNVMIWSGNHLGHGCQIADHTYLSSHICISGYTKIGERSFVGVNSTFKDYLNVGSDCFIAMDASVTTDLEPGSVVLGAKATVLGPTDPLGNKLKRSYFGV